MDYRVQVGDTLSGIATRFAVTLRALATANPQIIDPDKIFSNDIVHVPSGAVAGARITSVPAPVVTYTVQQGDTKSRVARVHNVALTALLDANPQVHDGEPIHPGDVLNIPGTSRPSAPPSSGIVRAAAIDVGSVAYSLYPGGGEVTAWTTEACRILGVPSRNWAVGYLVLCRRESSGRANAINDWDSNAHGAVQADGYPLNCSRGVAQCIPPTFATYHAAGTSKSIYDPVANIAASIRYVMSRYGVRADGANLALEVQQADPNRSPMGY